MCPSSIRAAFRGASWKAPRSGAVGWPTSWMFHRRTSSTHVETIFRAEITAGCGGGNYCRNSAVRRDRMAVFLLKGVHGPSYVPPACSYVPDDVTCSGPFADWVAQSLAEGIMFLCDSANFCPGDPVLRDIMAVLSCSGPGTALSTHLRPARLPAVSSMPSARKLYGLGRAARRRGRHGRLRGRQLLPRKLGHPRANGGISDEDVRSSMRVAARWQHSSYCRGNRRPAAADKLGVAYSRGLAFGGRLLTKTFGLQ